MRFRCGRYPLRASATIPCSNTPIYRELRPAFVLARSLKDPYGFDHPLATWRREVRISPRRMGIGRTGPCFGRAACFCLSFASAEQCEWKPSAAEFLFHPCGTMKRAAFRTMARRTLWGSTTRVQRGVQCIANSI